MEKIALQHLVGGRWVAAKPAWAHRSPGAADDLVVNGPTGDAALLAEAMAAARAATLQLRDMGIEARSDALAGIARQLAERATSLGLLIARETGKTVRDAEAEVVRASRIFGFFAGEALRNPGERFESTRAGNSVEVRYEPVGVVGAITPWNFPVAIPAWKLAPALAFGNAVVWKPSELASATASALAEIIAAGGLPDGAVSMVLGDRAAGAALVATPGLDALTFTGSQATGAAIRQLAAPTGLALQQEMGGVNGLVVLADANLDLAVSAALNGAFFAAGQRCTATSRILVDESVICAFTHRLHLAAAKLKVGDPRDRTTDVGPLASMGQHAKVSDAVRKVADSGARTVFGGPSMGGCYFAPTLFADLPEDSLLRDGEVFGPVAGLFPVQGYDQAIALINSTPFGLSAGICTTALSHAEAFKRDAQAGMVMVNLPTAGVDYHAPFGGVGASSYGAREQGRAARTFYTHTKTAYQMA